jgi:hypothetical protein
MFIWRRKKELLRGHANEQESGVLTCLPDRYVPWDFGKAKYKGGAAK